MSDTHSLNDTPDFGHLFQPQTVRGLDGNPTDGGCLDSLGTSSGENSQVFLSCAVETMDQDEGGAQERCWALPDPAAGLPAEDQECCNFSNREGRQAWEAQVLWLTYVTFVLD